MLPGQGQKNKGIFQDDGPSPKVARMMNPQFQQAFVKFDTNGDGSIDITELYNCLQAIQMSVEAATPMVMFPHPFSVSTVLSLFGKFGNPTAPGLNFDQFSAMCQYLEGIKNIFKEIDCDHSGKLDVNEFSRALFLSDFHVTADRSSGGQDTASLEVARQIATKYDDNGDGNLTFDGFVRMRVEWDEYISAWNGNVSPGANYITPQQTLALLEAVKRSMEPLGQLRANPLLSQLTGFDSVAYFNGLICQSQFTASSPFSARCCESLVIRFGSGNPSLTFEQFCIMMTFLKAQKAIFSSIDTDRNGSLDVSELANAFKASGMDFTLPQIQQIGNRYDADRSGKIEFDEFLQMMTEWSELATAQSQFVGFGEQRATAQVLQGLLSTVRIVFTFQNGNIPIITPFSIRTCRLLVALFGTPLPGEPFAKTVTYSEYTALMYRVKMANYAFQQIDLNNNGTLSFAEIQQAIPSSATNLPDYAIRHMLACYQDHCVSGEIAFDEFLAMLLECEMYHQRFTQLGLDLSTMFNMVYSLPRWL